MAEPGRYCVQAVLELDDTLVYSNQIVVTVAPPASREEERLAADFFTPEVGQVLTVNGSRALERANGVLSAALELKDNSVSSLAAVTLATPLSHTYKLLEENGGPEREFGLYKPDSAAVRKFVAQATEGGADRLVNAMGHARFLRDAPLLAGALVEEVPEGLASFAMASASADAASDALPLSDSLTATLRLKSAGLTD
jgi:hypothetical protein